jgi:hypothetical protein
MHTLPPGISPISVGNTHIHIFIATLYICRQCFPSDLRKHHDVVIRSRVNVDSYMLPYQNSLFLKSKFGNRPNLQDKIVDMHGNEVLHQCPNSDSWMVTG